MASEALREHNAEVRDATSLLLTEKVPALARELDQQLAEVSVLLVSLRVCVCVHMRVSIAEPEVRDAASLLLT